MNEVGMLACHNSRSNRHGKYFNKLDNSSGMEHPREWVLYQLYPEK